MVSSSYSTDQAIRMLHILDKKMMMITSNGWPDFIESKYPKNSLFFFKREGLVVSRSINNGVISWLGPIEIDEFWEAKISQSISLECNKQLKSIQKDFSFKNLRHLICRFHKFKYIGFKC
jgi:hypothetical protein